MERKAIELGGIVRNLPDNTVKDGTFQELINLRPRDGALRPVGRKDPFPLSSQQYSELAIDYGALYNFPAVTDPRNICSSGWHVPTRDEFNTLVLFLGGSVVAGGDLKEDATAHWLEDNASNSSRFTALPGGKRSAGGVFDSLGLFGGYITATDVDGTNCYYLELLSSTIVSNIASADHNTGLSVRLMKDSTTLSHGQEGTYTGVDGKTYRTIAIGAPGAVQEWLAVNLAETKYRDGTTIPIIEDSTAWSNLATGAMCAYQNIWTNVERSVLVVSWVRDVRHIHQISDNIKVYIGFDATFDPVNLCYWVSIYDTFFPARSTFVPVTSDMCYASWNNILAISDHTTEITSILIFNETSNTYDSYKGTEQEPLLPELPPVTFQRVKFGDRDDTETTPVTADTVDDGMLSEWLKMNNEKADRGFLTGCLLLRCAWEMVDGTIIKQSMPDKVYASELVTDGDRSTDPPTVTTTFTAYKIHYQLHCDPVWLADIQERYKGIIKSLVIYTTAPRSPELGKPVSFNIRPDPVTGRRPGTVGESSPSRTYDVSTLSEYIPNIEEETYYFLKEYSLKSLVANTLTEIKLDSVLDIFTRQQLPINNFSHHSLYGKSLFVYNSRLFLSNIKNYLFRYINVNGLITPGAGSVIGGAYNVHLEFDIAISNNKIITVRSEPFVCNYYNADGDYEFWIKYQELAAAPGSRREEVRNDNSYWGYPDARAREARVIFSIMSFDGEMLYYLAGRYDLHSIASQNFSYHEGVKIKFNLFMLGSDSYTTPAQAGKGYYYDHDRIQATELNNPFYFPPINSYRVQGKVLGLSTNAIALSSGQFGQFPIYAFTNEGIWTLSIGTGETLINTITPLSREVCNNPRSITPIDGGTAFTSGRGLFIISGNQVIEISETAEGKMTSRMTGLASYNILLSQPNLSGNASLHCSVLFLEYLSGAIIGFDYINSELIISKYTMPYSWVYSLKSKMWFKISQSWSRFVNCYPKLYAWDASRTNWRYDIGIEDFRSVVDDLALVFGQTRPIKISGADFKKIHRVILGGNIQNDITPVVKFAVAVFGTTDNKTWMLLNNGRDFGTDDIMLLGRSQYSVRQIIIVFGGHVEADSYLNYLTFDFEERYGGKLR